MEGEVSYRKNDMDTFDVTNITLAGIGSLDDIGTFDAAGDVSAPCFMANVCVDCNPGPHRSPFVGGGWGLPEFIVGGLLGGLAARAIWQVYFAELVKRLFNIG